MTIPLGPHCTMWSRAWIPAVSSETIPAPGAAVPWAHTESGWICSCLNTLCVCAPLGASLLPAVPPFPAVVVVSLSGPALVHAERAQAGERPALLQTVQRQPAPGHCEIIVTALSAALPGEQLRAPVHPLCPRAVPALRAGLLPVSAPGFTAPPLPLSSPCPARGRSWSRQDVS